MQIFLYEFSYFLAASLAILVSISAFALFILTYRYEKKLLTVWRALGFILLALAFLFLIWERKEPAVGILAVIIQAFALYSIYRGVKGEPKLVHLVSVPSSQQPGQILKTDKSSRAQLIERKSLLTIIVLVVLVFIILLPGYLYIGAYLLPIIELIALAFVISTIVYQVRRYKADKIKINVYPLVGYVFLAIRGLAMIFYRLPDPDIVILRKLTLEYSFAGQIGVIATILAFVYLGLWAWNFVKVRVFLRTYVVFISMVILVSTVGALIFTLFTFKVIENNNLELMLKGAETESVIMSDRANIAMFIARIISEDDDILGNVQSSAFGPANDNLEKYLESAEVDIIRIYNIFGEVTVSPSDPRDRGRVFAEDDLVAFAINDRKQTRSFDTAPGVLADYIIARAIRPLVVDDVVIGAVEVGYKFDNAFVDFSKERTDLDVTIYTDNMISATTIKTLDEVSRFVGSEESRNDILNTVLVDGETFTTTIDRFGEIYYMAYSPVRDVNGEIIGMVAVGTPTYLLIDAMRQRLVTTFIIVSLISALISLLGYYLMPSLRMGARQIGQAKK